jgi:hypothetical protein
MESSRTFIGRTLAYLIQPIRIPFQPDSGAQWFDLCTRLEDRQRTEEHMSPVPQPPKPHPKPIPPQNPEPSPDPPPTNPIPQVPDVT